MRFFASSAFVFLVLLPYALSASIPQQLPNIGGCCIQRSNGLNQCEQSTASCKSGYVRYESECRRLCTTKADRRVISDCELHEMCLIQNAGSPTLSVPNIGVCIPSRALNICEDACIEDTLYVNEIMCWSRREGDVIKCGLYCDRYPC